MHISDGVLSGGICAAAGGAAALVTGITLRYTRQEQIPRVSVMTAAFFAASLIHIKLGPVSAHLTLNGMMGILLGISAFPAILVALIFQAVMFQHGGITTLGVNSLSMGIPALVSYLIFRLSGGSALRQPFLIASSFAGGFVPVLLSALCIMGFLYISGEHYEKAASLVLPVHLPVAAAEGIITAMIVLFLKRVKPSMLAY